MTIKTSYHVVPASKGGWNIKKHNDVIAIYHFESKQEAITAALHISRKNGCELFIHARREGLIENRYNPATFE